MKWRISRITAQHVEVQYVTLVMGVDAAASPVIQAPTSRLFGHGAIKGVQAAVLQLLHWDENNSAFLITDLASQKKKMQENDFTHEESETMAFQILEWIVSQSWRWRQF